MKLSDGRMISAPLAWFPRLLHATPGERADWRLIGAGQGIHWDQLDEDISVEGLLAGRASSESQTSLARWLHARDRSAEPATGKGGPRKRSAARARASRRLGKS